MQECSHYEDNDSPPALHEAGRSQKDQGKEDAPSRDDLEGYRPEYGDNPPACSTTRSKEMKIISKYDALECPYCGGDNLHQTNCATYWRDAEDSEIGASTFSGRDEASFCNRMNGNPSPRRDGIIITFSCEGCAATSQLNIIQHKGSTYLEWEKVDKVGV